MPQSDGYHKLKNIEIDYKDIECQFWINPEEMIQQEPSRSTVTQTVSSAYIDDFGGGLPTIYIKGNTGFSHGLGVERFKKLRNLIRSYYSSTPGKDVKDEIIFHNFTDDESWVVHTDPQGFKLLRSKSNPLLYMYEIYFICIRKASHPKQSEDYQSRVYQATGSSLLYADRSVTQTSYQAAVPQMAYTLQVDDSGRPSVQTVSYLSNLSVANDGLVKGIDNSLTTFKSLSAAVNEQLVEIEDQVNYSFDPYVTLSAMDYLRKTITRSNYYLSTDIFPQDTFLGKINDIKNMKFDVKLSSAIKTVLLEALNIYDQATTAPDLFSVKISGTDIKRVINNIRWINDQLSNQTIPDYMLISVFRTLEKSLAYFIHSELYDQRYGRELNNYVQASQEENFGVD